MDVVQSVGTLSFPEGILMENHQIDNCNPLQDLTSFGAIEIVEFCKMKEDKCAGSQCRSETDAENEDCVSDGPSTRKVEGKNRMLMREWLECNADKGNVPGLRWLDKKNRLISIAWKHGSKSTWSTHDGEVFESWAKYTGKYNAAKDLPRKWKANFRCALNSLPDVAFVPEKSTKAGNNPCQVYRLLDEKLRKKGQRRSSLSQVNRLSHHQRVCLPDTTTTDADEVIMTSAISKQTRNQCGVKRKSETTADLTSKPKGGQPSGNNNSNKVLIPTTVWELCSEDETMYDISLDEVDEVVCETQLEETVIDDQTLLLPFEQTSSIDLGFEDIDLQEPDWQTDLDKFIYTF